jgi:hypothetical protein
MKLKYVILGHPHLWGRSVVLAESIQGRRVVVRDLATGDTHTVSPKDLGPAGGCKIEQKLLAHALAQPHYLADKPTEAVIAKKREHAYARHGRFHEPKDTWARHWVHEYHFADVMRDHKGRIRRAIEFDHEFEHRFVQRLEELEVRWSLEATRFTIPTGHFLPDFYLSEYDLYIELTESALTHKHHKLAGMHERHPEVRVAVLTGETFEHAMQLNRAELIAYLEGLTREQMLVAA